MSTVPEQHDSRHPTFKQYVTIAIILFAITIVEFLIILPTDWRGQGWTIAPLVILSGLKFAIVIMFYMHLKFDAPMFTVVFLAGLALSFAVGVAVIGLFDVFTPSPRAYAAERAQPYEGYHPPEDKPASVATAPAVAPTVAAPSGSQELPPTVAAVIQTGSGSAGGGDAEAGAAVFTGKGQCFTCHTLEGVEGASGILGPPLDGIGTAGATRKAGLSAEAYILESINDPDVFIVEGCMTGANTPCAPGVMAPIVGAAGLTDGDIADVVAFLLTKH